MKKQLKKTLRNNGQTLKWFWSKNLKRIVTYKYFSNQLNGHATMQEPIETAILKFLKERDADHV